jgi:hypothetical protein
MKEQEVKGLETILYENYLIMIKKYIALILLLSGITVTAQQTTEHINMIWTGYYNTLNIGKSFSVVSDAQLRTKQWMQKWSQLLIRSGINYTINDHLSVTGGLAFFKNAQYDNKEIFLKNEWRPWQEFSYQTKFNRVSFIQRLRTEQRFLQQVINNSKSDSYEYIFRLRYRFDWQFPLQENYKLLLGNEVLINPHFINTTRFFDQNRTFAGIQIKLNTNTNLQLQYLKIFQWRSSTSVLEDQNIFRVNIYQQFHFKKEV